MGLVGLFWISGFSVLVASMLALTFSDPEPDTDDELPDARVLLASAYKSRNFWLSTLWWTGSYPLYQLVYGYESSLYSDNIRGSDSRQVLAQGIQPGYFVEGFFNLLVGFVSRVCDLQKPS